MEIKIALLVLYNHRYEKNIEKIKALYRGKFTYVYQLIPFYDGDDPNIIPVYGSSYYFQIFISQAYAKLKSLCFTHYFIVADDMIINPAINENNIFEIIGLKYSDAFITNLLPLQTLNYRLKWMSNAVNYKIKQRGLEIEQVLPSREKAQAKFRDFSIPLPYVPIKHYFKINKYDKWWKTLYHGFNDFFSELPMLFHHKLDYPIIKGYSDILLIPCDYMIQFSTYSGAFAASKLFVEFAIPTSLVLSVKKGHLKTSDDIQLNDGAMWTSKEVYSVSEKNKYMLSNLIMNYPVDKLFLHPIKLSKWE